MSNQGRFQIFLADLVTGRRAKQRCRRGSNARQCRGVIGRQISHFYVIRTLGSGGMGVVYEAQDTRLPRSVAIKVLKEELSRDVEAIRRFKREARLASSLNHPNICTILDVNDDESQSFIAMELLEGASLKARLLQGPMTIDEITDITSQVADALGAAHDQGIIHRDITPANIFLAANGVVKLLDFGLAKHFPASGADAAATEELTSVGVVHGTVHYMAPEQLSPVAAVDYRCDLYALGVVLYQMATGTRPFDIQPRGALIAAIQSQPHIPLRQLAPHHPPQLARIVDTLLAKDPQDRYQSAATLRAELAALHRSLKPTTVEVEIREDTSIAVLPFEILGPEDSTTIALRDGLAGEISSRLSRIERIRVAPRTSIRALDGLPVREIAQLLSVNLVIEGTLQVSADRVRTTANAIDAAHERVAMPSLTIDRAIADTLTMQDEIAREVCEGLASAMARPSARRYPQDPEAYHAFKRGQHLWKSCFAGGWRAAIEHFQHAIDRDPGFAPAHVAFASAYNFLGFYSLVKPSLAFAVARRSAERALVIDPTLAPASIEIALAKFGGEWDWEGAEEAFRHGIAIDPRNPLAHVHYSWLLMLLGREDAAFAEAQRGHALAPSSRLVAGARSQTMYLAGRYDEAIRLCTECLRFDPTYVFAVHVRGLCHLAQKQKSFAVRDLEEAATLSHRAPFYLGLLGYCYGAFGMREQAVGVLRELTSPPPDIYVAPQCFVFVYAGLGDKRRALEHQEKAYEDGASPFNYLAPFIRRLYGRSPQHKKRLEQMRLVL
jgi:serine/threonine protein kinase/tetratricopeptide (TPR) repeat protein